MVQFECPRVIHPLVSFTFGVYCGVSISQYAGKGKCCIWPVNKVEIHFAKIGFVDCKWPNLNAPGSYTPRCHSLLGSIVGCPFHCMQEKGNAARGRARWRSLSARDALSRQLIWAWSTCYSSLLFPLLCSQFLSLDNITAGLDMGRRSMQLACRPFGFRLYRVHSIFTLN